MAQATFPNDDSTSTFVQQKSLQKQSLDVEVIRALTPIFIAGIGGLIGILLVLFTVFNKDVDATKFTAAMGLAGTAITGAAGLAQPGKGAGSDKPKALSDGADQVK